LSGIAPHNMFAAFPNLHEMLLHAGRRVTVHKPAALCNDVTEFMRRKIK